MPDTNKFTITQYPVSTLISYIRSEKIAIPEIQRPFVWSARQVRDLIDSLYNGYPTGYLIIWQNPDVKLKDGQVSQGKEVLIDGQQRITALMTSIVGVPIIDQSYRKRTMVIAFNPLAKEDEERFAVRSAAHERSSFWIPDISVLFKDDFDQYTFINEYLEKNPEVKGSDVSKAIQSLISIKSAQLGAITLNSDLSIDEVTEIFVRINSAGKSLNQADFAMSKIAADDAHGGSLLRKTIDYFCHAAKSPEFLDTIISSDDEFTSSPYAAKIQWLRHTNDDLYDPSYDDMLRVSFMHKFGRGKIADLVSLLSGRDFDNRTYVDEIAMDSFTKLNDGVMNFINQYNFEQFVLTLRSVGFTHKKLIRSYMNVDFAYTLFLLLKDRKDVPTIELKRYVQKWFILSNLTGRYTSSPESQFDRDLREIEDRGFLAYMSDVEEATFSDTFWSVSLPQSLETSSTTSPFFNCYIAAQIWAGDRSFLSNTAKVSDLINAGDVHHIFPREYLKQNGFNDSRIYNQVSNYTFLDTTVNINVGKKPPHQYMSEALNQTKTGAIQRGLIRDQGELMENLKVNCIPEQIFEMTYLDYPDFLKARRQMMAKKIRTWYESI